MSKIARALNVEESPAVQERLQAAQARVVKPLSRRERMTEAFFGGGMVVASLALALAAPTGRSASVPTLIVLTLAFAGVSRITFDVVGSYTHAAQVVLVLMLFLLPPNIVPLLVVAALVLARLPDVARGERQASRLVFVASDSWFAVGPALVLTAAGAPAPSEAAWWLLVAALVAQLAFDFVTASVRALINHGVALREQVHESAWIYLVDAMLAPLGLLAAIAAEHHPWAVGLLTPLIVLLGLFSAERRWRIGYILELSRAYRGTAALLGDFVEADHSYTGDHSREVVDLSLAVAYALSLSPAEQRRVEFAALLHDVGKIAVPKEIIDKPGPLDDDEWEVMRLHTVEGESMLAKVGGVLGETGLVVRASHEHYDGSGYPDATSGEEIPIEARVVACCDAYSAMTTDRAYREARSKSAAIAELRYCAGTQFDPAVVMALIEILEGSGGTRKRRFVRSDDASAPELDERDVPA
jgi:HD-GYP domain-containing protein (c-di-GMP phosphodiesterase class II)